MSDLSAESPELDRLWDRVAERLERNGLRAEGIIALDDLSRDERHALAGLLGRRVTDDRVRVDLAVLDGRLRTATGEGVVTVARRLRGPLVDRPGRRNARAEALRAVTDAARAELDLFGMGDEPWVSEWLEDLRRSGTLGKTATRHGTALMTRAVRIVAEVTGRSDEGETIGRNDLATRFAGDAHALDDGHLLSAIVLRAMALRLSAPSPTTAVERRMLWHLTGVSTDEVSATVLTAGLRPSNPDSRWLADRSDRGWETHLTHRDVERVDWNRLDGNGVLYLCENPRVLEAALDAGAADAIVCTQGNPNFVVEAVLNRVSDAGWVLTYHGDFDWPGITIAARILARPNSNAWRFSGEDYEEALTLSGLTMEDLPVLTGNPIDTPWDPILSDTMQRRGRVVHEELVLDWLLEDLKSTPRS